MFNYNFPNMFFPFGMQFQNDQNNQNDDNENNFNGMPFGFNMNQMPFGFDMSKMPFQFGMNQMPFGGFDMSKMAENFDMSKMPIQFDFSMIEQMFKMFSSFFGYKNNGEESEEKADEAASAMPFGGMDIPKDLLQFVMRLDMSPKGLEKLQACLDKVFELYSK